MTAREWAEIMHEDIVGKVHEEKREDEDVSELVVSVTADYIARIIRLAVEEERERCAKIAESWSVSRCDCYGGQADVDGSEVAALIRAPH